MIAFGIGCFQFRYSDDDRLAEFEPVQFKTELIGALEQVENISNVRHALLDYEFIGFRSFEEDENGDIFPVVVGFEIYFDIFIPKKVQYADRMMPDVELFHVHIKYGYEKPVAFVWYEANGANSDRGSDAVLIVRKYLEDRIPPDFVFDVIGPSPFHANFKFSPAAQEHHDILDVGVKLPGYGLFALEGPSAGKRAPLSGVVNFLTDIFSRYYYLQGIDLEISQTRARIIRSTRSLLSDKNVNFLDRIKKSLIYRRSINSFQGDIIEERFLRTYASSFMEECDRQGGLASGTALDRFFQEFRDSISQKEWSEFGDVARFFEERRLRFIGNLNAIFAGVIGGLVGAVIGAAMTNSLNNHSINQAEGKNQSATAAPQVQDSLPSSAPVDELSTSPEPRKSG